MVIVLPLLATSVIIILLRDAFPFCVGLVIFVAAFVRADWGNGGYFFPLTGHCAAATVLIDLFLLYVVRCAFFTTLSILGFAGSRGGVIGTTGKLDSAAIFRAKI